MSWMNVLGKIFHCTECPYNLKIDYEPLYTEKGPTHMTQIGDDNINLWFRLHEKYNDSEDVFVCGEAPEEDYFVYLHEELLCEKCAITLMKKDPKLAKQCEKYNELMNNVISIFMLLENYKETVENIKSSEIDNFIDNIFIDRFHDINPELFSKTIGSKTFKLRGKREELILKYIQGAKDDIINHLKSIFRQNKNIQYFYDNFRKYSKEHFSRVNELSRQKYDKVYYKTDISEPENLNNHISYYFSNRTPVKTTPQIFFYQPITVDNDELISMASSLTPEMMFNIDEEATIERIKDRLYEIADIKDLSRPKQRI